MSDVTGQNASRSRARIVGIFFLLSVVAAVTGEFFVRGTMSIVLGLVAVVFYFGVTLLIYKLFQAAHAVIALLALLCSSAGLALEAARWNPRGMDVAMVFHAVYCLLVGYLIFRCSFLPRILGVPMAIAGMLWLTNLFPTIASSISSYTLVPGLIGEAIPYLWLLLFGVTAPHGGTVAAGPMA